MEQVHIVFQSGGFLQPPDRVRGVYEDQLDAFEAAAKGPLLYARTYEVIPSSRTAADPDARPEGAATAETGNTSGSSTVTS